jgi:hypothetical protein
MRRHRLAALFFMALAAGGSALAQGDSAAHWRALTAMDVEAAHLMLLEDHPGAAQERGDIAFQRKLAAGYAAAKARAAQVTSYDGYLATLAGLSVSLGDKHIWSRPLYVPETREWAGIVIARRGKDYVVADDADAADGPALSGARLISCDGIAADRLAEERLGQFKVVSGIEAQLVQRAFWLLVDEGNPFLKKPRSCRFEQGADVREVALKWRSIPRAELSTRLAASPTRGAAGFGVRKVGQGWWIALQSLSEKAVPVVEEVRAKAATLRAAPYVVLDMRGNGGGNSQFGRQIAEALWGPAFVSARFRGGGEDDGCAKAWRASERNLKQLEYYKDTMGPRQGKEATEAFTKEYDAVAAARAAGAAFSARPTCPAAAPTGAKIRRPRGKSEYGGRVVLLTDNSCFSSCLLVTDDFHRLGALHVGETTDANTHYMEVREDKLPSGLSMFSTLQALSPSSPAQIGPFVPERLYDGSIADTAALESWVEKQALEPAANEQRTTRGSS